MRTSLRYALFSALILSATTSKAQNDRFAYAITDVNREGAGWTSLRKIDLATGEYGNVLLNGTDAATTVFDAASKKALQQQTDAKWGNAMQAPFATGVAAAAYDRKHNRLYYTPMFIDQLRYIDLKTMQVYYVTDQSFTGLGNMHNDEGKCITRMVITPEGEGYAITNDAHTVIRFTTGRKTTITKLGELVDDPSNKGISVHNRCTSFGGDMIADDRGNLFIISARNQVFKVNTETRVATHLGGIQGLPATFTVNGAAVDGDGNLLVTSAMDGNGNYVVNPVDWNASLYGSSGSFRSSDLANSNHLATGNRKPTIDEATEVKAASNNSILVFPNPVIGSQFKVQFRDVPAGDYTLELRDVMGRTIMTRRINVAYENQVQPIQFGTTAAGGVYLVKVINRDRKSVYEQKIIVQQ